jgi:hypothetical protein
VVAGAGSLEPPQMSMMNLVTVLSSADPIEIEMAKDLLDSVGVPCVI